MNSKNIIIVEDDEITAMNLKISLQNHGYIILAIVDNIADAKAQINAFLPSLILIDISLQETSDGIELASYIKDNYSIPFIYLTSYSDNEIISKAKTTEPYGYIVKPFDPKSLHATIQVALFRFDSEKDKKEEMFHLKSEKLGLEKLLYTKKETDKPIVHFGEDYHLDISICETFYKGDKIRLTKKENAFLRLLVAQMGQVVSFQQAMDYVWEESGATENSVRTLVWRLRNKLEDDIIQNASGIGYFIEG